MERLEERRVLATFINPAPINFPAGGGPGPATPYPSLLNVSIPSSVTASVLDVNVRLNNLSHTFPADINLLLVGPTGQDAYLMEDAGGGTDVVNQTITFDDEAAGPIVEPLVTGSYMPTVASLDPLPGPAPAPSGNTTLAAFDPLNPNGNWSLFANDDQAVDTGSIAGGWRLDIQLGGNVVIAPAPDGAADTVAITVTATNLQVNINGGLVEFDEPLSGILSFTYNGSTDNEAITVTDTNPGVLAFPFTFTGGGGTNSLNITGLDITNPGGDGLNVGAFNNTTISTSTFNGNAGNGVELTNAGVVSITNMQASNNAQTNLLVSGATSVTINPGPVSHFDNSTGGNGIQLLSAGAISLSNVTASNNLLHGIDILNAGAVTFVSVTANGNDPGVLINGALSFSDTGGTFSNNDDHGIQLIDISGDVTLVRTTADDNDSDGLGIGDGLNATDGGDLDGFAIGGNLTIRGARFRGTAPGAQQRGVFVDFLSATSAVTFNDSTGVVQSNIVTGNTQEGVLIGDGGTTATFVNGNYSDNGASGGGFDNIQLSSFSSTVSMSGLTANNGGEDGIDLDNVGAVNFTGVTANGNDGASDGNGIEITNVAGAGSVVFATVTATGNFVDGLFLQNAPSFSDTDGVYSTNRQHGLDLLDIAGNVTLTRTIADDNDANDGGVGDGLHIADGISDVDTIALGGDLIISGGRFRNPAGTQQRGVFVESIVGSATFQSSGPIAMTVTDNQNDGVEILDGGVNATFTGGTYSGNDDDGIDLDSFSGTVTLAGVTANGNTDFGFEISNVTNGGGTGTVTLSDLTLAGNGTNGGSLDTIDIVNYTTDTTNTGIADSLTVNQAFIERTAPAQQRIVYVTVTDMHLFTQDGNDTITVQSTGASGTTTTDAGTGNDSHVINGDGLSANNSFAGGAGNDSFTLNITVELGNASLFPIESLEIKGDAPSGATPNSENRDSLTINDNSGTVRDLEFQYDPEAAGAGAGAVDITSGPVGPGYAVRIEGRTLETVRLNGSIPNNFTATVVGSVNEDDITVVPLTRTSALVFLDGDPWHGPADGDFFAAFPGVAGGGSTGPDLLLNNLDDTSSINVLGSLPSTLLSANFEAGLDGFTIDNTFGAGSGLWHRSTGRSGDGLPNHSPDFSLYYGQNETPTAGGDFNTGATNEGIVTSPTIHIPFGVTTTLSFNHFRQAETGDFDLTVVDVLHGTTTNLFTSATGGNISNTGGAWANLTANLTPFAGQDIQLRFRFDTVDSISNDSEGWFIDDVNVSFAGASIDDQLIVYATSENALVHGPTAAAGFNPFGFGVGVIIPGQGVGNAFDQITASDTLVSIVNTIDGQLIPVTLDPNSGFAQTNGVGFGLIVNAGFEAAPGIDDPDCGDGIDSKADDIFVTPSFNIPILINGGDPAQSFTPEGDKANLGGIFEAIDIFSDKGNPPAVTFVLHPLGGGPAPFGVGFSSIECFGAFSATTVNLIGDNNDPAVDQTDNFVVVGQDTDNGQVLSFDPDGDGPLPTLTQVGDADCANEFVVNINGSFDIPFSNVQFLNVFGFDQVPGFGGTVGDVPATPPGTLSPGGQDINVDTLEITACADNADLGGHPPRGWGIDVFFNEGLPNQGDGFQEDLIIYHTSISMGGGGSVSEDIVIQPSGPDNGEIRATNAVDGSMIVVIQYVANTDIIVVDDDGSLSDTDTLTLRGTNPDTVQTSGSESFAVDFDAAGDVANPFVTVRDIESGLILYRLRSFTDLNGPGPGDDVSGPIATVTFDMLAGNDTLSFRPPENNVNTDPQFNSGIEQVIVLGGLGDDSVTFDYGTGATDRHIWHNGRLFFDGGAGRDSLTFLGDAGAENVVNVTYTPGPIAGNGRIEHDDLAAPAQVVDFVNLEPVVDLVVAANLIVNATNANNAINYSQVPGDPTRGRVSVDDQEYIDFSNKTTLTINALAGSDTINLNNPSTPTSLTTIVVNGGDPTGDPAASDKVIVNGTTGPDVIAFTPNAFDDATVAVTGQPLMELNTTEKVVISGAGGGDTLTINGTAFDDTTVTTPAGGGSGTFRSIGSPALDFFSYTTLNVNGGGGGQDIVQVDGTTANDAFTSAAAAITLAGSTVNIGAGIDLVQVNGLAGNDNIDLSAYAATPLFVHGNDGNDVILGGTLADTLSGDEGNDTIDGNGGADQMFGNVGSDLFIWDPGDGSDLVEGGANESDIMRFNGAAAGELFTLTAVGTRVLLTRSVGGISMDIAGVEQVDINALGGTDRLVIQDLYPTDVRVINYNLGGADGASDVTDIRGRNVSDVVNISNNAGVLDVIGLRYDVHVQGATAADGDVFQFFANNGNDNIVSPLDASLTALFAVSDFELWGGAGDDYVAGYGELRGDDLVNSGNDTLVGGSEGQTIIGGGGNDLIFGGGGADTIFGDDPAVPAASGEDTIVPGFDLAIDSVDGGPGFDTILVQGTSGNDRIDARQDAIGQVRYDVRGINGGTGVIPSAGTETDVIVPGTVEELKIVAGSGDDIIRVTHSDTLISGGTQAFSLRFTVDGGPPGASDRLTVTDDGIGDTTIHRVGGIAGNGSYQIGALAPVVYTDVEFASLNPINPVTGGTGTDGLGRLFVFKHDPFEENNDRTNATFLGSDSAINIDPVIDPGPDADFGLPGDEDWYRIVAQVNGDLDVRVFFRQQGVLANGRAGLPGDGNLNIAIHDATGNLIAVANSINDDERLRIPAVAGQTYYLRVVGALGAINVYSLSVINTPAAVPFDLELDDRIVGHLPAEGVAVVAGISTTSFNSNLDGQFPDDFFNGKVVSFKFTTTTVGLRGEEAVVADYVGATGVFTLAFPLSVIPAAGDTFQVESVDTGRNNTDNITRDNTPTIFLRVPNVINNGGTAALDDVPFNGSAPGLPPDGTTIPINFTNNLLLDVPAGISGFRVPIFVVENGTSDQGPPNNVLAGYAQPVDPVNRPGVFSFTFGSAGSFIASLSPDSSYFLSARVEIIDGAANPIGADPAEQAQGYGDYAQSLEIVVDTTIPPIAFGDPGVVGDGLTADSDSFVIPNPETVFDLVTNDLTPTFWGRAEADATVRLFGDSFRDLNGNGVFDFIDVNMNDVFDAGDIAIDTPPNGVFDPNLDVFLGQTTAIPLDGNQQEPNGFWAIESVINFNDPRFFVNLGGVRTVFATAEDVAGNVNDNVNPIELDIFIDVQGPQITDVEINNLGNTYQLFDPKPSTSGPTPLVNSLVISVRDLPPRVLPFFDSPAFKEDIANNPGHYLVKGDYNGIIPILDIVPVLDPIVNGQPATGTITIVFRLPGADGVFNTFDDIGAPLPDDRFTLIIDDTGIIDFAGNLLDGESNADEPHQQGAFPPILGVDGVPTGDGIPGGDFIARFTVDSRPEVGVWAAGSAWIDTNGNDHFDPNNLDFTNRDITYMLGLTSDDLFAGNFATIPVEGAPFADGFDKLAAYGKYNGLFRWLVDTDNDGIPNIEQVDPAQVNGLPIAGNFGPFAGDEVALFTGTQWRFDTNHNFQVDNTLNWPVPGYPVVGDFDGDGLEDLGTWTDDTFSIDLSSIGVGGVALPGNPGINGTIDKTFKFGFIGPGERPVARDMNMDGMDDLGLFVPARDGVPPTEGAEWYFLISGMVANNTPNQPGNNPAAGQLIGPTITGGNYPVAANGPGAFLSEATYGFLPGTYSRGRIVDDPLIAGPGNIVRLDITPFGNDRYLQFGDTFAVPILGNFDPPSTLTGVVGELQTDPSERDPLDVNGDGDISPLDALIIFNHINNGGDTQASTPPVGGPYLDVNGDTFISAIDALLVFNYLNNLPPGGEGEAEGEAADAVFSDYNPYASAADAILNILATDAEAAKKKK